MIWPSTTPGPTCQRRSGFGADAVAGLVQLVQFGGRRLAAAKGDVFDLRRRDLQVVLQVVTRLIGATQLVQLAPATVEIVDELGRYDLHGLPFGRLGDEKIIRIFFDSPCEA